MERPAVDQLLVAWCRALSRLAPVEGVLHPEAVVERHGWTVDRRGVLERFVGAPAIASWIARNRGECVFEPDGAAEPTPEGWQVRYRMTWGDFVNGGLWRFRVSDGAIVELSHFPDDVPEAWQNGVPAGKWVPGMPRP